MHFYPRFGLSEVGVHGEFLRFEDETAIPSLHRLPLPSLKRSLGTFIVCTCCVDVRTVTNLLQPERLHDLLVDARYLLAYEADGDGLAVTYPR